MVLLSAFPEFTIAIREGKGLKADDDAARAFKAAHASFLFIADRENEENPWRPGRGLAGARWVSEITEAIISACAERAGPFPSGASLLAMGGLGRQELAPYSDVDLLLRFDDEPDPESKRWASAFMRLLWDSGLAGSLGVRTDAHCLADAAKDSHFLTAISAGRNIMGDANASRRIQSRIVRKYGAKWIKSMLAETRPLLEDAIFGDGPELFAREPELKLSPGGIRSRHHMEWIGLLSGDRRGAVAYRTVFGMRQRARMDAAYDYLVYLRNRVHYRHGREVDTLANDDVAAFSRAGGTMTAEGILSFAFLARRTLATAEYSFGESKRYPETFLGEFASRTRKFLGWKPRNKPDLVEYEDIQNGICPAEKVLASFLGVATGESKPDGKFLSAGSFLAREPDFTLSAPDTFRIFKAILSGDLSATALRAMDACGLLARLVPPWKGIRNLPVAASFHDLPVGPHTMRAICLADVMLGADRKAADALSQPISAIAARYAEAPWIPKLALLLHDTGKAFGGDHAKNGAAIATTFLASLPVEPLIKEMIADLVENHLLLGRTARDRDPDIPGSLSDLEGEFALKPWPVDSLGLLSIITWCDSAATDSASWKGYRASRLERLVKALDIEFLGMKGAFSQTRLIELKIAALEAFDRSRKLSTFARNMGDRYILSNDPSRIERDMQWASDTRSGDFHLDVFQGNDHLRVKIVSPDGKGLFSSLSGILLVNGADIVRADIHTLNGVAIDDFTVTQVFGNDLLTAAMSKELGLWVKGLEASFRYYLKHAEELAVRIRELEKASKPVPEAFHRPATVLGYREGDGYRFEVACTDRPALLFDLLQCLSTEGFDIRSALIDTTGWQVHDSFVVAGDSILDGTDTAAFERKLLAVAERKEPAVIRDEWRERTAPVT